MLNINIKKFLAGAVSLLLFTAFVLPAVTFAADAYDYNAAQSAQDELRGLTGLVPCGNNPTSTNGVITGACTFDDFITMINRIINWIISIATVIFTISAIYGGFLWILSGESPGKKEDARKVLWSTLIGFVIILVSWLIVYTILNVLVIQGGGDKSILQFIGTGN